MTAYSRSSFSTSLGKFLIEIHSVNKRYLDVHILLPSEIAFFEAKIKHLLSQSIHRGSVTIKIRKATDQVQIAPIQVNHPLVRQLVHAWREIAVATGHQATQPIPLELFATHPMVLISQPDVQEEESLWLEIKAGLDDAIIQLVAAKYKEGKSLQEDLVHRCLALQKLLVQVEELAPSSSHKFREKLKERLDALVPGSIENEERILREVCVYAEKVDITEECVRLKSHLNELHQLLEADLPCVGKELEFLLQEISREVNTSTAKSHELPLIKILLAMKSEVERIKEQIQNIE